MNDDWDQPTLFDAEAGRRARDASMAQVEEHADPVWMSEAESIMRALVTPWTTDVVWETLHRRGIAAPREPRALGPLVMKLYKAGLIERTGRALPTERPRGHRNPKTEWRPTALALSQKSWSGRRGPMEPKVSIPDF